MSSIKYLNLHLSLILFLAELIKALIEELKVCKQWFVRFLRMERTLVMHSNVISKSSSTVLTMLFCFRFLKSESMIQICFGFLLKLSRAIQGLMRERERVNEIPPVGIPIGNLTSQIFANVYMNEFDQFVKHELKVKYYARYTDDFLFISDKISYLINLLPSIQEFLEKRLTLTIHPKKINIQPSHRGVDFLGYVVFPNHRLLRARTRKRMIRKLNRKSLKRDQGLISSYLFNQSFQSYLGVLSHANAYKLTTELRNKFWFLV